MFEAYITFEQYRALGGKVQEQTAFSVLERKAQRYLDTWTQNRIKESSEVIRETLTGLIDMMADDGSGNNLASFTNGNISMSFDVSRKIEQDMLYYVQMMLPLDLTCRGVDNANKH
jgi:hypothetical protein